MYPKEILYISSWQLIKHSAYEIRILHGSECEDYSILCCDSL
jgi:hypothetical protein